MLSYFLKGLVLGFPNAALPGPFQAYLLSRTVQAGWRRTLPAALAPLLSDGPIIVLTLLVLSRLAPRTLGFVQTAGGLFLLYLAFGAYRAIRREDRPGVRETVDTRGLGVLLQGAILNALNPAPYLFWSTVGGPILLAGFQEPGAPGFGFLIGFYGTLLLGFALFIRLFGAAGALHPKVRTALRSASAVALFGFGLFQLFTGGAAAAGLP